MDYLKIVKCERKHLNNAVYDIDSKGLLCRIFFDSGTFHIASEDGNIGSGSCEYTTGDSLDFIGKIKVYNDESSGFIRMMYFDRI